MTVGALGSPEVASDLTWAMEALGVIGGVKDLATIGAGCATAGVCAAGLDATDTAAGMLSDLNLKKQVMEKLNKTTKKFGAEGGYYLWVKVKYRSCVSCTSLNPFVWGSGAKCGKYKWFEKWHPCPVPMSSAEDSMADLGKIDWIYGDGTEPEEFIDVYKMYEDPEYVEFLKKRWNDLNSALGACLPGAMSDPENPKKLPVF